MVLASHKSNIIQKYFLAFISWVHESGKPNPASKCLIIEENEYSEHIERIALNLADCLLTERSA